MAAADCALILLAVCTRKEMTQILACDRPAQTYTCCNLTQVSAYRKKLSAPLSTASALVASQPAKRQATDKTAALPTTVPVQHLMQTHHEQPARPSEMQELRQLLVETRHEVLTLRQTVEDLRNELRASRGVTEPQVMVSCPLCLEDVSSISAITLEACQHSYCRPCLSRHLQHQVQHKRHVPSMLQCPQPACTSTFSVEQCEGVLQGHTQVSTRLAIPCSLPICFCLPADAVLVQCCRRINDGALLPKILLDQASQCFHPVEQQCASPSGSHVACAHMHLTVCGASL